MMKVFNFDCAPSDMVKVVIAAIMSAIGFVWSMLLKRLVYSLFRGH